ncbi:MAG: hypothetical protein DRI61_07195 [Chloroflexi bacterium]|nr:MAG: hypothetical protein DRI61_07195 [Chloroflexota bacterium]
MKNISSSSIVILTSVALILRLLLWMAVGFLHPEGFFTSDSQEYWGLAQSLLTFHTFTRGLPGLPPEHERTPVYPLFLAALRAVGLGPRWIVLVQVLLSVATVWGVAALAGLLTRNWKAGLMAGWLMALDVPSIVYANLLLTETLFTFLLVTSTWLLVLFLRGEKAPLWAGFSGLILGLATLCRPIAVLLPLAMFPLFFLAAQEPQPVILRQRPDQPQKAGFPRSERKPPSPPVHKRALKGGALYTVGYILVVLVWVIRNWLEFGTPFLSTIACHNLLNYRAAGVYAVEHRVSIEEAREILQGEARALFPGDPSQSPVKFRQVQAQVALSVILRSPQVYARNAFISAFNMLVKPLRSTIDLQLGLAEHGSTLSPWGKAGGGSLLQRLFQSTSLLTLMLTGVQVLMLAAIWPAFGWGLWKLGKEGNWLGFWAILLPIVYFVAFSAGPEAYARFRVPVMPFIAIGGGVGFFFLTRGRRCVYQ